MSRILNIAAAQMGPIARNESRSSAVARMCALMKIAGEQNADIVVFPELALTTFFPRWFIEDQEEIDGWFERQMPGHEIQPLFDLAKKMKIGFSFGYAELTDKGRHFNTSIIVDKAGNIVGKYRKIHLPGHKENEPWRPFQHLEKRYFEPGDLGFKVFNAFNGRLGLCICNDRRWPETFRVLGLQGAELVMLGYNTPAHYPPAPEHDHLQDFHNHLVLQAGAYQNGTWIVGVAKAGHEEGCDLIGGTCIISPTGVIMAQCKGLGDEVIVHECDLNLCQEIQQNIFNFELHREPESYKLITSTKGIVWE